MRNALVFLGVMAGITLGASVANAQQACLDHEELVTVLATNFGEVRVGVGLAGEEGAFLGEMFVNPTSSTWTVVVSNTAGMACIVAAGTNWNATTDALPVPGQDG